MVVRSAMRRTVCRQFSGVRGLAKTVRRSWQSMHSLRRIRWPPRSDAAEAYRVHSASSKPGLRQQLSHAVLVLHSEQFSCGQRLTEGRRYGDADQYYAADQQHGAQHRHQRLFQPPEETDDRDLQNQDDANGHAQGNMDDRSGRELDLISPQAGDHLPHEQHVNGEKDVPEYAMNGECTAIRPCGLWGGLSAIEKSVGSD